MKVRHLNSYLAIPKSIDLDKSIDGLVSQLNSYGLPKPALDRFTDELQSCSSKGELGVIVNKLRPEVSKFYEGASWVSIDGESKFMYPSEITEEYKKASDEYSKAVKEVKGNYKDKRLEKARERRDQAFQNVNSAIETTTSSVIKYGSGMLSGNPDTMIDTGLSALGDILKLLSKSIASSILKIAKTYDKVRNGDEFSKAELRDLKDIEKTSIDIYTSTPNEIPDFDSYVTPMSDADYEEIKDEQDSIAQANFDEVGEITDWESAFKYGKAKLKQIHGLKYDESKATEVLEGLKAKYPDTPQCVIGALKYGGFHKSDKDKNSRHTNNKPVLSKIPNGTNPVVNDPNWKEAADKLQNLYELKSTKNPYVKKPSFSEYGDALKTVKEIILKYTPDNVKRFLASNSIVSVIVDEIGVMIGLSLDDGWFTILNDGSILSPIQEISDYDMYRSTTPIMWYKYGEVVKNSRLVNSTPFSASTSVHGWKFNASDCEEVDLPIQSLDDYDYPPITDILKKYFDSINEVGPNCVWICEKFITEHKLIDSFVVYGMYNPFNQNTYAVHAVVELGGTYFDLRSMYEKYKGQDTVPYNRFLKYRSLSRVDLLELNKNMRNTRKLNSSNEFYIHGHGFSKLECKPYTGTPLTAINEVEYGNYPSYVKGRLQDMNPNLDSIQACEKFYRSSMYASIIYGLYSPNKDGRYIPYAMISLPTHMNMEYTCDLKAMYDEVKIGKKITEWKGEFLIWREFGPNSGDWKEFQKFIGGSAPTGRNSKIANKWIEVEDILLLRNPDMTNDQLDEAIKELDAECKGDFEKAKRLAAESNRKLNSANEFTIHGKKFSKSDCLDRNFTPYTELNQFTPGSDYPAHICDMLKGFESNLDSIQVCEKFYERVANASIMYGIYSPDNDGKYIPYAVIEVALNEGEAPSLRLDLKSIYDNIKGKSTGPWGDFRVWKEFSTRDKNEVRQLEELMGKCLDISVKEGWDAWNSWRRSRNSSSTPYVTEQWWEDIAAPKLRGMCKLEPSQYGSWDDFYAYCEKHPEWCTPEQLEKIYNKFWDEVYLW